MRSSVNLRKVDVLKIAEVCEKIKIGQSALICRCLQKYLAAHPQWVKSSRINRLVEYQPDGVGYQITNIVFNPVVFNLAVNFRVFCRLSVSKMVTMAIHEYLDEIVCEISGEYEPDHNYVLIEHEMKDKVKSVYPKWIITWSVARKTGGKSPKRGQTPSRR